MSERIPCKTPGCSGSILPSTAEETGGYCMPCVQKKAREEREKNRVDVNLYDGITDPVEIIKIKHQSHPYDPLKRYIDYPVPVDRLYAQLTEYQTIALREYAIILIRDDIEDSFAERIAGCLAAFTTVDLDPLLSAFVDGGIYYPAMMFQRAGDGIRDALLHKIHACDEEQSFFTKLISVVTGSDPRTDSGKGSLINKLNRILSALAWIGGDVVVKQFAAWRRTPPKWKELLYIPPEQYAHVAGWELTPEGTRRNLYSQACYPLLVSEKGQAEKPLVAIDRDDTCPWCGRQLMNLFDLDLTDSRLRTLHPHDSRLPVVTCDVCTCYSPVFGEFTEDGTAFWSPLNATPEYLPDDADTWDRVPGYKLMIPDEPRSPFYASDWCTECQASQVGGVPSWVQDSEYPVCPKCGKTMSFIGQISNEEIQEYAEGFYYAFVCSDCRMTCTTYQQT